MYFTVDQSDRTSKTKNNDTNNWPYGIYIRYSTKVYMH